MSHRFFIQDQWVRVGEDAYPPPQPPPDLHAEFCTGKYTFSWGTIQSINLILKGACDDKKGMEYFFNT